MSTELTLDQDLLDVVKLVDRPVEQAALELIVMGLHRRGSISQEKAAELLGMRLADYLDYANACGIPSSGCTKDERGAELRTAVASAQAGRAAKPADPILE